MYKIEMPNRVFPLDITKNMNKYEINFDCNNQLS